MEVEGRGDERERGRGEDSWVKEEVGKEEKVEVEMKLETAFFG